MNKLFLLLFLFSPLFSHTDEIPVLYEGRIRPFGTLPKEKKYLEEQYVIPLDWVGHWISLSDLKEKRRSIYPEEITESILKAKDEKTLKEALLKGYRTISGKPYLKSANKTLYYPSEKKLSLELGLFRLPLKILLFSGYVACALLFFFRQRKAGLIFLILVFAAHTVALALRSFILGRPPVSNMAETILYVPAVAILTAFFFSKMQEALLGGSLVAAVLILLLPPHQSFETVQAVLDSQKWLIIHVLMVVGSYGIFFFSGILGHIYLLYPNNLEKIILHSLYLGSGFLILGTLLGGVWAAQSWGRFWDWDPKEAWAFISSGIYLILIHAYKFKKISSEWLARGAIIGLMTITFTWYGVNYILSSGLHSYGFGSGGHLLYYAYLIFEIGFLSFALRIKNLLYKNWVIEKKERKK